ncbi:MAG: molybdopterin-dependent oxidoreductase [Actinobacteria bacterium]|nr:molybdopterin-dependent oxidoreductase [Actinomycetota bacterium]
MAKESGAWTTHAGTDGREKSVLKGLSFISSPSSGDGNTSVVDVKDGRILRIRPLHFDWKYERKDFNPWRMEARGHALEPPMKSLIPPYALAYKKRVYSPNRILYPLKRVDWNPSGAPGSTGLGGRNTANRGASKYVRVSWNEALDILAGELKRIHADYGPYAVLSQGDGHGETKIVHGTHGCQNKLLNLLGGFTQQIRNSDSWEGSYWGAKHAWGMEPVGQMEPVCNLVPDIAENTELLLFWGCDPETTPWAFDGQMASRLVYWWRSIGIDCVFVCPDLNYGAAIHADKWIPIRPNTDAALYLAIAYVWLTEGTYDQDYVATHTFGFDKFQEYVLGDQDDVPKTPAWAAEKCGVPARIIKALACDWASKRTTILIGNGGPGIRGPYATEPARLQALLLAMQGLGKPGVHQMKMLEWGRRMLEESNPMPRGVVMPNVMRSVYTGGMLITTENEEDRTGDMSSTAVRALKVARQIIPKNLIHDAILNPPITWYGTTSCTFPLEDQFVKYTYPAPGCPEVHMIWTDSPCWITCWNDSNAYIKALRSPKIEFIVAQHPWMENDCLFADLILPANTKFEVRDISTDTMGGQFNLIVNEEKAVEPRGESRSDYEIVCMVAERLGLLEEYSGGKSIEQLVDRGFEGSGVKDMVGYQEFKEKGYFVVPTDPDWEKHPAGLRLFHEDPENHPLKTPSGKIEFYSQNLARYFPDDPERPPVPHWIEKGDSHDEALSGARAAKYPLVVLSNHPRWRCHANHDDLTWLREIETCKVQGPDGYKYEPLWINTEDAAARGIVHGDVVKIHNQRGAVLAGAYVTERVMPGAVYIDHGARYDPIVPGELDRGGAINTLTPHNLTSKNATGMVSSGFLVQVEKVDLNDLRRRYPEAFGRPYHKGAGLCLERVLAREGR